MKYNVTLLSALIALTLTGCGTKEPEKEDVVVINEKPVIKMNTPLSVDEGGNFEEAFQIIDDGNEIIVPKISEAEVGELGFRNDSGSYYLTYTAPENVSVDQVLKGTITASDSVNKPVVFDFEIEIKNVRNSEPELESIENINEGDNTSFSVEFVSFDEDQDSLSYELISTSSNENVQVSLNESSKTIDFNIDTLDVAFFTSDYTLFARDAEEEVSVTFTVNITKGLTSPEIVLSPQDFDFNEGDNYIVRFQVSDNQTSYEDLEIEVAQSPSNSYDVDLNIENREILFSNLDIVEDSTETLNFKVTNKYGLVSTEVITVNLKNTMKTSINAIEEDLEILNQKYEFIVNNGFDELVFFDFYIKIAEYKNPDKVSDVLIYRDTIETELESNLTEIKSVIDYISDFVQNSDDESQSPHYEEKIVELTKLLNDYGKSAVVILNSVAGRLNSGLPEFSESDLVQVPEEYTSTPSFSRYVGNASYGSFVFNKFVFSQQYKFMEDINFLKQQCL